jgi:signal transduction histidine kinase/AraC-like DNA-binding protein/DNA-binding LacI/PurR family transcriptional regulator
MTLLRIGVQIEPNDSFWIQVEESIYRSVEQLSSIELVPIEINDPLTASFLNEQSGLVEELLAHGLATLICKDILPTQLPTILNHSLPIVYLAETNFQHPLFTSPSGLYEAARLGCHYLAGKLQRQGHILCVGGLVEQNADNGQSRLDGFEETLRQYPGITFDHIPTAWSYSGAKQQILDALEGASLAIDAIFGLSDTVALAACDALEELGILNREILVAGINGDPLALAAISKGKMTSTIETPASELGRQAIELAIGFARNNSIPAHFSYEPQLITIENVHTIALQKLIAIADIPSKMVGVNRRQERNRLKQLETSVDISRHVGPLLNRTTALAETAKLIRINYDYEDVQIFLWSELEQGFTLAYPENNIHDELFLTVDSDGILGEVIRTNTPIFVPNVYTSGRFPPDPQWPESQSRAVLPIQLGSRLVGLLDLHSHHVTSHQRHELIGLQLVANQLSIVLENADLYAEAVESRARAEQADQLKTRLLANVSHELRTPLNVITGYAHMALATPNPYDLELPPSFQRDLRYIHQSGQHLLYLINDLLSLSQAEIGALDLFKEILLPKSFLEDVFNTFVTTTEKHAVRWQLNLSDDLPMIEADQMRIRQILLNLLHNASKFTDQGQIELGADVMPPYLHLWVRDTGHGIPADMRERIFEPFVKVEHSQKHHTGAGLGLSIARRLVVLHGGFITLESRPQQGSTFHIYLPLPDASGQSIALPPEATDPVLLVISNTNQPTPAIAALCQQRGLTPYLLSLNTDLNAVLREARPVGLAWDVGTVGSEEWVVFERLRTYPQLAQLPLIIYAQESEGAPAITNVLMKPSSDRDLIDILMAFCSVEKLRSVLIVDDEPDARQLYGALVAQALPGRSIYTAENGAEALSLMEEEIPGLVILDLMMPEVNGFTVLHQMRTNPKTRHVPVVIMSGRLLTSEDVRHLDYGQVVFHSKHLLTEEETTEALRQVLSDTANLSQPTSLLVKKAVSYLHQHYQEESLSRSDTAQMVGISLQHLDRIFRQEVGLSVNDYLNRLRILRAQEYLTNTNDNITFIAMQVGFSDPAYFSRVFRKQVGQSPKDFRKQN